MMFNERQTKILRRAAQALSPLHFEDERILALKNSATREEYVERFARLLDGLPRREADADLVEELASIAHAEPSYTDDYDLYFDDFKLTMHNYHFTSHTQGTVKAKEEPSPSER